MSRINILADLPYKSKHFFADFASFFADFPPFSARFHASFNFFLHLALLLLRCLRQAPGIFLYHFPLGHDLMAAAHAFQPEIRAYPQDFPLMAPAGMRLFQLYHITHLKIPFLFHISLPFFHFFCHSARLRLSARFRPSVRRFSFRCPGHFSVSPNFLPDHMSRIFS